MASLGHNELNGCVWWRHVMICMGETIWLSIKMSLKFVLGGPINNVPALVQIMAWRRPCDEPLSEPMMISLLTHNGVTRPRWVNPLVPIDTIWHHETWSKLVRIMARCLTAPSHYLNLSWLIITKGLCHSPADNFNTLARDWYQAKQFERRTFEIIPLAS